MGRSVCAVVPSGRRLLWVLSEVLLVFLPSCMILFPDCLRWIVFPFSSCVRSPTVASHPVCGRLGASRSSTQVLAMAIGLGFMYCPLFLAEKSRGKDIGYSPSFTSLTFGFHTPSALRYMPSGWRVRTQKSSEVQAELRSCHLMCFVLAPSRAPRATGMYKKRNPEFVQVGRLRGLLWAVCGLMVPR